LKNLSQLSRYALLATLVASLAACSVLESDKIDYKSAGKAPTLEVPPDLSQLSRDNRYAVPGGAVSANAYQAGIANAPGVPTAVPTSATCAWSARARSAGSSSTARPTSSGSR
jgi:outer membrane protein assembly factor BamC